MVAILTSQDSPSLILANVYGTMVALNKSMSLKKGSKHILKKRKQIKKSKRKIKFLEEKLHITSILFLMAWTKIIGFEFLKQALKLKIEIFSPLNNQQKIDPSHVFKFSK